MAYQPPPPSREYNHKRLVDIIRIGHDTLFKEHKQLQDAIIGIYNFQAIPSDEGSKKIYQYELVNQPEYDKHEIIISSIMGVFEQVVNDSKAKLFALEMQIPTGTEYDMPPSQTPVQDKGESNIKDTRSIFEKLKGSPKQKRVITPEDQYQDGLDFLRQTMKKMGRLERFQEYQSYGIDRALTAQFETMQFYLQFHRTRFRFEIAQPILRVHRQYCDLIKEREKLGAIRMGAHIDDEMFKTRNDFPQQTS